jgi:hypothetical protein
LINRPLGMPGTSSWVKTPTAPRLSCTCRKKGFITSGRPRAGAFVSALLIFFKGLFLFLSPYHGFLLSPLCGLIKGFCQEKVIGDPDPVEICSS